MQLSLAKKHYKLQTWRVYDPLYKDNIAMLVHAYRESQARGVIMRYCINKFKNPHELELGALLVGLYSKKGMPRVVKLYKGN